MSEGVVISKESSEVGSVAVWEQTSTGSLTTRSITVLANQSFIHMHRFEIASGHEVEISSGAALAIL